MLAEQELHRHLGILRRRDKRMAGALKLAGLPKARGLEPGFASLIRIIVDQQVSTAAGAAIWAKLQKAAGGRVTPRSLLALGEEGLRANGMSGPKTRYALGLAEATAAGKLNFRALSRAGDDEVRATLTAFKGVGDWTADIYLLFGMGRPDVWPVGDLAIQHAIRMLHGLNEKPGAELCETLGAPWRPYRSSAAIFLWHYFAHMRRNTPAPRP
ncbi:MAG: DNA-3-methyladenine glycosylase [Rhodospirillaceae bacterium]